MNLSNPTWSGDRLNPYIEGAAFVVVETDGDDLSVTSFETYAEARAFVDSTENKCVIIGANENGGVDVEDHT